MRGPKLGNCTPPDQRGILTLVVSLTILMLSTLVTFSVVTAVTMEQKISSNNLRSEQAFLAAEAGMLTAVNYLENDPDADGDGAIDPIFDTNGDGVGDANVATVGPASVLVTTTDLAQDMMRMEIRAQGYSDDRSVTRTLTQRLVMLNPLPNAPANPIVSKGSVVIGGTIAIHAPSGHSTIWSGADVELRPGKFGNTDFVGNDSSLAGLSLDDFFRNTFGFAPAAYRASMVTVETTTGGSVGAADGAAYEVIWDGGNAAISGTILGCRAKVLPGRECPDEDVRPVIVIIDGDASIAGDAHLYGLLYVAGTLKVSGSPAIHGAIVTGGDIISGNGSHLDLWFAPDILAATRQAGPAMVSAGSWRDF